MADHHDYGELDSDMPLDVNGIDWAVYHVDRQPGLPLNSNWSAALPKLLDASCTRSGADFRNKTVTDLDTTATASILDVSVLQARQADDARSTDHGIVLARTVRRSELAGDPSQRFAEQVTLRTSLLRERLAALRLKESRWAAITSALLHVYQPQQPLAPSIRAQDFKKDHDDDEYGVGSFLEGSRIFLSSRGCYHKQNCDADKARMYFRALSKYTEQLKGSLRSANRELVWLERANGGGGGGGGRGGAGGDEGGDEGGDGGDRKRARR